MSEIVRRTQTETKAFLDRLGFNPQGLKIANIFPTYFKDRQVIHVIDEQGLNKVWKFRPDNESAFREQHLLQQLWSSYRFSGTHIPYLKVERFSIDYVGFEMEYLGVDLKQLAEEVSLVDLGYLDSSAMTFSGFTCEQIDGLIEELGKSHLAFARQYSLFHGDIYQEGINNVVYHPQARKLFLVDAEALNNTEGAEFRFLEQIEKAREWMYQNLSV